MESLPQYQVLVVDDEAVAAEEIARFVEERTQLRCHGTAELSKALELVSRTCIRVVVLDQRMPQMVGTEFFKEIRRIDPRVRGILLSARAEAEDVRSAYESGFATYVSKFDINDLPDRVLSEFTAYNVTPAAVQKPIRVHSVRRGIIRAS